MNFAISLKKPFIEPTEKPTDAIFVFETLDEAKKNLVFCFKLEIDATKEKIDKVNNLTLDDVSQLGLF